MWQGVIREQAQWVKKADAGAAEEKIAVFEACSASLNDD
jgi:hypothetical protein